jgi:regulator of protease activity HflC (stomatin/prohibitin superfamily)
MNIPTGVYALESSCGKNTGVMEEGCYCCYCSYKEVKAIISKNTIRFNAPIYAIPTKDNVMINLDVGVNFHIGGVGEQGKEDAVKFFYNFGPNRLQELLIQESEEGIRDFVRRIKVARIRDAKTEMTVELVENLREKFKIYGVVIESVNIMTIIIPEDLRTALMQTTGYDVYLQKQVKEQEYRIHCLENKENKSILKLKKDLMQNLFTLQHDKDVEEIAYLSEEITQETKKIVAEINALRYRSSMIIEAENKKELAVIRAQAQATKVLKSHEA